MQKSNGDGDRRSITLVARDLAGRGSGRKTWYFYLDSKVPRIDFLNVAAGSVFETLNLQGSVEDQTNVKEVKYSIARWNYAVGAWRWYNGSDWDLTAQPGVYDTAFSWPDMHDGSVKNLVYWSLDSAMLTKSGFYPGNLLNAEGKYMLEICVTDFSLSADPAAAGNPHNDAVVFYIDRNEPAITWETERKDFYSTNITQDNTLVFEVTAADENGINAHAASTSAMIHEYGDKDKTPVNGVTVGTEVTIINPAVPTESNIKVTISSNLPTGKRYTLVLTVADGAGNVATINNTLDFYLDNTAPSITIDPVSESTGVYDAITGRVMYRGIFSKSNPNSPVSKVAFAVGAAVPDWKDINGAVLTNAQLIARGWRFRGGTANSHILDMNYLDSGTEDQKLMEINEGLSNANILLYNTRFLNGTGYLGTTKTIKMYDPNPINFDPDLHVAFGTVAFDKEKILEGEEVNELVVHFLAVDEAGNSRVESIKYYVYGEGDRPKVTSINNPNQNSIEIDRQLNGRIRISGNAVDNYRILRTWFRVLLDGNPATPAKMSIPKWDEFWNADPSGENQTWQTKNGTEGWYMANGGSSSKVAWWAYVNTEGELDPEYTTSRDIVIEVMTEDTIWIDSMNGGNGGYSDGVSPRPPNLFSKVNSVKAFVVSGAPRFEDEWILPHASDTYLVNNNIDFTRWGSILTTNVRGRAAYSVTVKHDSGVASILWTPPWNQLNDPPINLFDDAPTSYSKTTYGQHFTAMDTPPYHPTTNPGIAVKAVPKKLVTGTITLGTNPNRTFMIWDPGTTPTVLLEGRDPLISDENVRFTVFTVANGVTSFDTDAKLIEATPETIDGVPRKTYEWIIVVDINADIIDNRAFDGKADYYSTTFSATEISLAVPKTSHVTAKIPVDNISPKVNYTHSTNVAGSAPTFGGMAGDTEGNVKGLSRVVLWFSRKVSGVDTSVPWQHSEKAGGGYTGPGNVDFVPEDDLNIILSGLPVDMPKIPEAGDQALQYNCIVIDRHDPMGNQTHHGHKRGMGFAMAGSGELNLSWYVVLNSREMVSGQVTAHFIVYDRAGNAEYRSQKLMILNDIPRITTITLATNIRPDADPEGIEGLNSSGGNLKRSAANTSALAEIRNAFKENIGDGLSDNAMGISQGIAVDTLKPGTYGAVYDQQYFNVRNSLLAVKVDADPPQIGSGKTSRNFRVEYVSNIDLLETEMDGPITDISGIADGIKAGRMYIINDPGSNINKFPWGSFGAPGDSFTRGLAFIAIEDGNNVQITPLDYGTPSVWELNSSYYAGTTLARTVPDDLKFPITTIDTVDYDDVRYIGTNASSPSAEFVYGSSAFGIAAGTSIIDAAPNLNTDTGRPLGYMENTASPNAHSLFIIRVFDGAEEDLLGDFALLSIRVNNNDQTPPYAQLYDLNPKTEGSDNAQDLLASLGVGTVSVMGQNRTRGGLHYNRTAPEVGKGGHIEPRTTTSLTSLDMGGAVNAGSATITQPVANDAGYFDVDTVSGEVIVRGFAEDDQRVARVDLEFTPSAGAKETVTILTKRTVAVTPGGFFLEEASGVTGRVEFTETVNLNRHQVEWAYYWDTETMPAGYTVGNVRVRAVAYNDHNNGATPIPAPDRKPSLTIPYSGTSSATYNYFNSSYPNTGNFRRYNDIQVNIRPYITGFLRNQAEFAHNTRSRQGRYMFARGETAVVKGFNLFPAGATTTISLAAGTDELTAGTAVNYGLPSSMNAEQLAKLAIRYRQFEVAAGQVTGNGMVTLSVNGYQAVNTGDGRSINVNTTAVTARPNYVQPWNIEYNMATEGSDLWDDFTAVHIWRSNRDNVGTDNGQFRSTRQRWAILNPAMSIDPATGTLYSSHNEGGSGTAANSGTLRISDNTQTSSSNDGVTANNSIPLNVMQFNEPILYSDVYRSPGGGTQGAATWAAASVIGRSSTYQYWNRLGGLLIAGPGGAASYLTVSGGYTNPDNWGHYMVESTYYNASTNAPGAVATPPSTDQFMNPHIITHTDTSSVEHIHTSYYDSKDGSIKYRYNRRGNPGVIGILNGEATLPTAPFAWTNLDGKFDLEDRWPFNDAAVGTATGTAPNQEPPTTGGYRIADSTTATDNYSQWQTIVPTGINANYRVVNYNSRPANRINAGLHNAIAVTKDGYPVVAYYDATNEKLKLAVSGDSVPISAENWFIIDNVIPDEYEIYRFGTGQFVSIAIDHKTDPETIHMAAMNSVNGSLVYIKGAIRPAVPGTLNTHYSAAEPAGGVLSDVTVRVVDNVGTVGRWCSISLDSEGNPWIAYHDTGYIGSRDGVKLAYLDSTRFNKGNTLFGPTAENPEGEDIDYYGKSISGWEAMHVPTGTEFSVENTITNTRENGRIGLECFPTRNFAAGPPRPTNPITWGAAVSYLSTDAYRIAYYEK